MHSSGQRVRAHRNESRHSKRLGGPCGRSNLLSVYSSIVSVVLAVCSVRLHRYPSREQCRWQQLRLNGAANEIQRLSRRLESNTTRCPATVANKTMALASILPCIWAPFSWLGEVGTEAWVHWPMAWLEGPVFLFRPMVPLGSY